MFYLELWMKFEAVTLELVYILSDFVWKTLGEPNERIGEVAKVLSCKAPSKYLEERPEKVPN